MTRAIIFPFLVVFAPQMSMAIVNHGVLVLAPLFTAAAGLSPEAVGLIGGLVGLGAVWCFACTGAIIPPLGPLRALALGCLLAAASVAVFILAEAWLMFAAAFLVGFGFAVTAPAGSQLLARHTPRERWGVLFSMRMAGVPAGGAVAGIVGAVVAARYDWRLAVVAVMLPGLLCAAFLAAARRRLPDPPPSSRFRLLRLFNPALAASPFRMMARKPGLALVTASSVGFAAVQVSVWTFLTTYLTNAVGLSIVLAGSLYSTMLVASFFGRIGMGFLADWIGSIRFVLAVLGVASALGAVLPAFMEPGMPLRLMFAITAATGILIASWNGLFLAEVSRIAGDGDVGETTSAATFFTFLGFMLSPPLFGLVVLKAGYSAAFASVAGFVLLTTAGLLAAGRAPGRAG